VQLLTLGDAGAALNKIILSKDAPLADLFFGVDNTFLSRALAPMSSRRTLRRCWRRFPTNWSSTRSTAAAGRLRLCQPQRRSRLVCGKGASPCRRRWKT
jgi:hypothetical protein